MSARRGSGSVGMKQASAAVLVYLAQEIAKQLPSASDCAPEFGQRTFTRLFPITCVALHQHSTTYAPYNL